MSEPYDLRSNIKGKPGSQGTLFQVRDKGLLNPAQRWPRGYTPERQAAVNEHLHGANDSYLLSDKAGTGPARRDLNETIKRSTVPPEHLDNAKFSPGQQELQGGKAAGLYEADTRRISIAKGYETDWTPIHEIGHHVSHESGTPHSAGQQRTPSQRGQEEAYADTYAHEHFRDRRGERLTSMRGYPSSAYYGNDWTAQSPRQEFAAAYSRHRPLGIPLDDPYGPATRTPRQQRFVDGKEAESAGETLFTTWDNGDEVTFHKPTDRPYAIGEKIGWR